jgi:hypothetical protein
VLSTHYWPVDTTQRFGRPGIFFPVAAIPVSTATRHLPHEKLFVRSVHLPDGQRLLASALRLQRRISRFHIRCIGSELPPVRLEVKTTEFLQRLSKN